MGLAGTYSITIIGTGGVSRDSSTEGTLLLWAPDSSLQQVVSHGARTYPSLPLVGTLDVNLNRLRAPENGSLTSSDPEQPGVQVREQHENRGAAPFASIYLTLGANGNRRDVFAIDGPYSALHVDSVGTNGFFGRWTTKMGPTDYQGTGHFCAIRVQR